MMKTDKRKIMIAGIGGASLGSEILKSLKLTDRYEIYGCDISRTAYGLYDSDFTATYLVDRDRYLETVIAACQDSGIHWLVAGGEQPMVLLGAAMQELETQGIKFLGNTPEVISLCSDKYKTFQHLQDCGVTIPRTVLIEAEADLDAVGMPCIVKPATGSGGSFSVFFAVTTDEAMIYADFIRRSGYEPIAQEYIDIDEGEFTIGVLSLPDSQVAGSIALRRSLDAKLSVMYRGRGGLVSSGYSQGYIGDYVDLCAQAELIARAVESGGPLNIQGRVRNGVLLPFEINPRFSASIYLRSLAGFNEVDLLIRYFETGECPPKPSIRTGWYLRSLTEQYIDEQQLK